MSKTRLAYVKTDWSQWTPCVGDESDDADEDASFNVDMDSASAGTKCGGLLKQVFPLRIGFEVHALITTLRK